MIEQKRQQHADHQRKHQLPEGVGDGNFERLEEVLPARALEQPLVVFEADLLEVIVAQLHIRKADTHQINDRIVYEHHKEDHRRHNAQKINIALPAQRQHHHAQQHQRDAKNHDNAGRFQIFAQQAHAARYAGAG